MFACICAGNVAADVACRTFICLKMVDLPDSPAPKSKSLIFSCSFWYEAAFAASTSFVCGVQRQKSR